MNLETDNLHHGKAEGVSTRMAGSCETMRCAIFSPENTRLSEVTGQRAQGRPKKGG